MPVVIDVEGDFKKMMYVPTDERALRVVATAGVVGTTITAMVQSAALTAAVRRERMERMSPPRAVATNVARGNLCPNDSARQRIICVTFVNDDTALCVNWWARRANEPS